MVIEHQLIMANEWKLVDCVLNGSGISFIVQQQLSLEIHQTYGIMLTGLAYEKQHQNFSKTELYIMKLFLWHIKLAKS